MVDSSGRPYFRAVRRVADFQKVLRGRHAPMTSAQMGRPHKGDRVLVASARFPRVVFERIDADAKRLGVPRSDVMVHVACAFYGIDEQDPVLAVEAAAQQQLKIGGDDPASPTRAA